MGNPVVHWELMSEEPQKAGSGINGGIVRPEREGPWRRSRPACGIRVKAPMRTGQTSRTTQLKLKNTRSPSSMFEP
jgi:hypothetical protein